MNKAADEEMSMEELTEEEVQAIAGKEYRLGNIKFMKFWKCTSGFKIYYAVYKLKRDLLFNPIESLL